MGPAACHFADDPADDFIVDETLGLTAKMIRLVECLPRNFFLNKLEKIVRLLGMKTRMAPYRFFKEDLSGFGIFQREAKPFLRQVVHRELCHHKKCFSNSDCPNQEAIEALRG